MALVLKDRVQETGSANTTVSFTLAGAVVGFQSFDAIGNGNTTFYAATDGPGNWEVGLGTYSTTGPTLTRTTILASSNTGSAVTFSGTVTVFATYPAGKSVNLDASGNVSPLGTVASGTWQGTTVGVAYGGTGVTSSSGANSVVLRDSNQNISVNHDIKTVTVTTAAGGTTAVTAASNYWQALTGTGGQTYTLPDATTLLTGFSFVFDNDATGNLTIKDFAGSTLDVVAAGGYSTLFLESNATVAGTWNRFGMIPAEVNWGTNSLDLGGSTIITNGTWQGTTIASGYGGTGLTTFAGANNALYSTSASALAAGTLPTAAGGTALTSFTANGALYATSTSALTTGTLPIASGGTNSTATPTAGGVGYGTGTAHAYTVAGTSGQYLTSGGAGAPTWTTLPSNVNSISFGTTGLTPSTATTGAVTVAGTLIGANGGTGQSTYTIGDLLQGGATNTLTKLAAVATGNALISGGVGAASSWGKIGLTTHVSGTLPIANGGTNSTATPTAGGAVYGTGSAYAITAVGTAGQALVSNAASAPAWTTLTLENLPGAWVKKSVDCATTAALTINTAQTTIDGVTLSAASRVLVKDQAAPAQNGIYNNVTTTTWTRTADADASGDLAAAVVGVDAGTVNGGLSFDTDFKSTDTLGTTAMNWNRVLDTGYTIPATQGGTGQTSYTVGDILYASSTTALSKLADAATGNALISGGAGVAPSYGKIGLTTHISGTLATGNGGTGLTTFTSGGAVYASSTSALTTGTLPATAGGTGQATYAVGDLLVGGATNTLTKLADVATGSALISGGVGVAPSYGKIGLTTHISGTLAVGNGGTGLTTLTANYIPYGNGTSAYQSSANFTYNGTTLSVTNASTTQGLSVTTSGSVNSVVITDTGAAGANIKLAGNGATTPSKFIRANSGTFDIVNNGYTAVIFQVTDEGLASAPTVSATNGIYINNTTIATSYSIPAGYSGSSTGPITLSSGVTVTVPSGSKWVVL